MAKGVFQKNLNFRIDEDDYNLVEKIAKEMGMPMSVLCRMLIKERLKEVTKDGNFEPKNFFK